MTPSVTKGVHVSGTERICHENQEEQFYDNIVEEVGREGGNILKPPTQTPSL